MPGPVPPDGVRFRRGAGLPAQGRGRLPGPERPALLLDRDGTLAAEAPYLHRVADLRLLPGAAALVAAANDAGIPVAVASNQSGIGRGLYGWDAYETVEAEIDRRLAAAGARLDARVACAFHPVATPEWNAEHARWRKPGPAMLELLVARLGADGARSWMVGDSAADAAAARAAGLCGCVHVATGHGWESRRAATAESAEGFPVLPAADAADALQILRARGLLR